MAVNAETKLILFWQEVNAIRERHALFSPEDQIKYIFVNVSGRSPELTFLDGHNLT